MPDPDFLDTNVLIYAYDPSDVRKQQVAQSLIKRALDGEFVVSSQVLAEFASTLLHKMSPAADSRDVIAALDALAPIRVIASDGDTVRRAVEARAEYGIHFYGGMILAAAERAGCQHVLSEDLNSGQRYFGITVENPFRQRD